MSEEEYKIIFSKNLRYYLDLDGKTQADLCEYMNVSSATVSDWCNGKKMPRMDKIQAICNFLRIEKSDLLEDKGSKNSSYYLYDEAKELAEFLYANPGHRVLFDAVRKVKKDDMQFVKEMIDRISNEK